MSDDLKIRMPEWARNMYNRLVALINAGGGGGGGEARINSISLNGVNVPPDANKNVALAESDPTVPNWAKQSSKPAYTASEVGALPDNTTYVSGVKGIAESAFRSGNVTLNAADVAALAKGSYGNTYYIVRYLKNTDISEADNGVGTGTSISGTMIGIDDDAGNHILDLVGEVFKTGAVRYKFILRNIGASPVSFGGYVDLKKDGTATPFFSHPAAIRQALDIIEATTTHAGLMSAADKAKLDGFAPGGGALTPSTTIPIPASGSSASYNMEGLTSDYELVRWNFSASPENFPPADLSLNIYNGYFTITNSGGTTSESMRPVFVLPQAVPITSH